MDIWLGSGSYQVRLRLTLLPIILYSHSCMRSIDLASEAVHAFSNDIIETYGDWYIKTYVRNINLNIFCFKTAYSQGVSGRVFKVVDIEQLARLHWGFEYRQGLDSFTRWGYPPW